MPTEKYNVEDFFCGPINWDAVRKYQSYKKSRRKAVKDWICRMLKTSDKQVTGK